MLETKMDKTQRTRAEALLTELNPRAAEEIRNISDYRIVQQLMTELENSMLKISLLEESASLIEAKIKGLISRIQSEARY